MKTELALASSKKPVSTQSSQEAKAPGGIISCLAALLLCVLAFIPSASIAATNDLSGLLQKGLFEEEANRNLDAATEAYRAVSAQYGRDRALAATAIFRLGEIYRKQSKTNEAIIYYERIVREFPDQETLVRLSRQNLTTLSPSTEPVVESFGERVRRIIRERAAEESAVPGLSPEARLLGQLKKLSRAELRKVLPSVSADPTFSDLVIELNAAERKRVELAADLGESSPFMKQNQSVLELLNEKIEERMDGILRGMELRVAAEKTTEVAKPSLKPELNAEAQADDEEKELRRIQEMIKNSPDLINAAVAPPFSKPPIFSAVEQGQLKVVKFLLDHGARVDVRPAGSPSLGRTPLLAAASTGQKAIAELLLANGTDIKARDNMGLGALHLAAEKGFLTVAELLIARGAEVNAVDNDGDTPLHSAARSGQPEMESLLIQHGAEVNARDNRGRTALSLAAEGKHLEAVKVLLAAKADPNIVDQNGRTPLSYAGVNLELLRVLLTAKADPNLDTAKPPLIQAADGDNSAALALLLAQGASPEVRVGDDGVTPLLVTIRQSNTNGIAALLGASADVNVQNRFGASALHYAVRAGNPAVLQMLLEKGANPNVRNNQGQTPLDLTKPSGVASLSPSVPADVKAKLAELLRAHGALDELPDFTAIRITRGTRSPYAVFEKDRNGWNHFTLFEALLGLYGKNALIMPFPDLTQIRIQRFSPTQPVERKEIVVNLLNATNGIDCTQNLPLEFGDLIEIPEREHRLADRAVGLTDQQRAELVRCVPKRVRVIFRSEAVELSLDPDWAYLDAAIRSSPAQSVLRSSADLSRVKVTRKDPAARQPQEFIVNVNPSPTSSLPLPTPSPVGVAAYGRDRPVEGFWLQNGDVIEVPEKPE